MPVNELELNVLGLRTAASLGSVQSLDVESFEDGRFRRMLAAKKVGARSLRMAEVAPDA